VAAFGACVDAGGDRSGSELFSAESATTLGAYVEMLKSGLRYSGTICHEGGSFLVQSLSGLIPRRLRRNVNSGFAGYLAACGNVIRNDDSQIFCLLRSIKTDYS
jgi:hypothetical protein